MTDLPSGYIADIGYTHGYYPELHPARAALALLGRGLAPPPPGPCCELGFGQGISTNIHAAAGDADWWGTDFNAAQAAFAQGLAERSGAGARLMNEAFADFCTRSDLPDFAFIGLHGIWSWVSEDNRALLLDFLRRRLLPGGLVYLGYNTLPGWAAFWPMRQLMVQAGNVLAAPGANSGEKVDKALEFARRVMAQEPVSDRINPAVGMRLKSLPSKGRSYLAHEYFNGDWQPMVFDEMARRLAPCGLAFAGSAMFSADVLALHFTPGQEAFLADIEDAALRESTRDFMLNTQFRKDYWIRGATRLDTAAQLALMRDLRLVMARPRPRVSLSFTGSQGETTLDADRLAPLFEALAGHRPVALGALQDHMAAHGMSLVQLYQTLLLLADRNDVAPAQDAATTAAARPRTARLNAALLECAPAGERSISTLASPVTGGGVAVLRTEQLMLLALQRAEQAREPVGMDVEALMRHLQPIVVAENLRIREAGQMLGMEASLQSLRQEAERFFGQMLPVYRALGI